MASVNAPMSNASAKLRSRKMTNPSPLDEAVERHLRVWQTEQSEWFSPPMLEVVREYATWRERTILNALSPDEERRDD
jgi:hypothetical protein